jgi:coenzyme F420-reducing hydrogenase delta subunit
MLSLKSRGDLMSFESEITKFREGKNLISIKLPNKKKYFQDLRIIEDSFTGRIDTQFVNNFIFESVQLVINAIVLFEKGYFDCSFYSLRQSLEISTTMVYLAELNPEKRKKKLKEWDTQSDFPMFSQMIIFLKQNKDVFLDMKENMNKYFDELEKTKNRLNKLVHKQGFNNFYIHRKNKRNKREFRNEFLKYIKSCIGAIAVLRLAIDPFPILLQDEEIYKRTWDTVTLAYTEEFIDKYIGFKNINNYKKTNFYNKYYNSIMENEKMIPCVTSLVKNQYIDREKIDQILTQSHLLSKYDKIAVLISSFSDKITKIYINLGILFYFTNTKSKKISSDFSSKELKEVKQSNKKINKNYDGVYLTYINIDNEDYFVEHNKKFIYKEINQLTNLITHFT